MNATPRSETTCGAYSCSRASEARNAFTARATCTLWNSRRRAAALKRSTQTASRRSNFGFTVAPVFGSTPPCAVAVWAMTPSETAASPSPKISANSSGSAARNARSSSVSRPGFWAHWMSPKETPWWSVLRLNASNRPAPSKRQV